MELQGTRSIYIHHTINNHHVSISAKDVVFRAIAAGKHVVTANKALIAAFLPELETALEQKPSVRYTIIQ